MTQEIQTKDRLSVDGLANNIQEMQRSTRMTSFFKRILFKKLKGLKTGELTIIDGSKIHVFGIPKSELKATLNVSSQEFYVFLGSGGTHRQSSCLRLLCNHVDADCNSIYHQHLQSFQSQTTR